MQVLITLHLAVTEEGVSPKIRLDSGGAFPLVSPALAAEAASVTQEVVEFAEYIASSTGSTES